MQVSTSPTLVPLPFADSGTKNVIPEAASPTPGLASLTTGFPPVTMTPLAAGGIPPAGQDMNGILNLISQTTRWTQAGGPFAYSSSFAADSNVNGYPQGAVISRADYTGQWISTADNNTVNPDTVGTNWVPGYNYGVTAVSGLTNANVTLTPAQAAKSRITLAGTLTGNVQIIFPTWTKDWAIINNTTGAFTVTAKTAAGTGIAIPQDASPTKVTGDGTNITQLAENIPPATASEHAAQLGQIGSAYSVRGLIANNNGTTPNTKFDASADLVALRNPTNGAMATRTAVAAITNDITVAGPAANGRDQIAVFPASNYVHFYYIWNGTTLATISSLTAPPTGPTLPTGYTHWAYIGVVILTASSNITPVIQRGSKIKYQARQASLIGGSSTAQVAVAVATLIPPNAVCYDLLVTELAASTNGSGLLDITLNLGVTSGVTMTSHHFGIAGVSAGTSQFTSPGTVNIPNVGQNYYYSITLTQGTGLSTSHYVVGYEVPNGAQ